MRRTPNTIAAAMPTTKIAMRTTTTIWFVSIVPKLIESGDSQTAMPNSAAWTNSSETLLNTPPIATADGEVESELLQEPDLDRGVGGHRHREVGERHRRLELDARPQWDPHGHGAEERDRERNVGEDAEEEGEHDEAPAGVAHRVPERDGVADAAEENGDRDQGGDRHQQPPGVDAVELLQLGRFGADGRRGRLAQLGEGVGSR